MLEIHKVNYSFQSEIVEKIIAEFQKQLKKNFQVLKKSLLIDSQKSLEKLDISILMKTFEDQTPFIGHSDTFVTYGIGTVGVIYNGNPYITLYLSLMALKTHNNIAFFVNDSMLATNNLLISMLNKIIEQFHYGKNIIQLCSNISDTELVNNQELLNTILFVGDKYSYQKWRKRLYIPTIYSGYGYVTFYIEDAEEFQENLKELNTYVFEHNIQAKTYRDNPQDAITEINQLLYNDLVVLFTKNKTLAKYFIENVKCKKLVINQNPFQNYNFQLDANLLIQKKQIVF